MNPTNTMSTEAYMHTAVLFLVADVMWIHKNRIFYNSVVRDIQKSDIDIRLYPALFAYACMVIGLVQFSLPRMKPSYQTDFDCAKDCLYNGGLLGFVIYGVYNGTNSAIFTHWNDTVFLYDLAWGTFVYTLGCFIFTKVGSDKT